jgi:hypothetical protein
MIQNVEQVLSAISISMGRQNKICEDDEGK